MLNTATAPQLVKVLVLYDENEIEELQATILLSASEGMLIYSSVA